jgi:hypothetical protein
MRFSARLGLGMINHRQGAVMAKFEFVGLAVLVVAAGLLGLTPWVASAKIGPIRPA